MMTIKYAESLKDVLIRKIMKAERDLQQLKMDYCRFVYGLSHRTKVIFEGQTYLVKSVDLDSMKRLENGEWSQPAVSAIRIDDNGQELDEDVVELREGWGIA